MMEQERMLSFHDTAVHCDYCGDKITKAHRYCDICGATYCKKCACKPDEGGFDCPFDDCSGHPVPEFRSNSQFDTQPGIYPIFE